MTWDFDSPFYIVARAGSCSVAREGALKPPITVDPLECSPEQAFCRHKKLIHVTPQLTRFVCTTGTILLYMLKCRNIKELVVCTMQHA